MTYHSRHITEHTQDARPSSVTGAGPSSGRGSPRHFPRSSGLRIQKLQSLVLPGVNIFQLILINYHLSTILINDDYYLKPTIILSSCHPDLTLLKCSFILLLLAFRL